MYNSVGVTAYNNGARGWDLFGAIAEGFLTGAVIGVIIGGLIAAFIYAAPAIGSYLTAAGELVAVTVTGAQIVVAGLAALAGVGIMYSSYNRKPAAPRNHSGSRKEAYNKAFYKGGNGNLFFIPMGNLGRIFILRVQNLSIGIIILLCYLGSVLAKINVRIVWKLNL